MGYEDFTDMSVWKQAFALVIRVYEMTKTFPADERFGLISDMRRAANSIAHNIAEGFGRFEPKDKSRFYKISRGSAYELISQVLVSSELSYMDPKAKAELTESSKTVIGELNAIIKTLET